MSHAIIASLFTAGCAVLTADVGAEHAMRKRLQAAHDATLRLEVRGHLDAAAIARGGREAQAFEVRADGEPTLVTVPSRFTETPR